MAYLSSTKDIKPREWVKVRTATPNKVSNTRRVERTLKLIAYLSEWRNFKEIATHLEIHYKSVFRYMDLLIQFGFIVEQNGSPRTRVRLANVRKFFNVE
ncbi:hypothetical protein [Runella sp.]|uniref:hypothetical protein n=1 Tax=Runella sp. TaxID=1960881 RepID=UPI003D10EDCD